MYIYICTLIFISVATILLILLMRDPGQGEVRECVQSLAAQEKQSWGQNVGYRTLANVLSPVFTLASGNSFSKQAERFLSFDC